MAPQRSRIAPEDSRPEAVNTKEKQTTILPTKARRGGHLAARGSLKDITAPATTTEVEQDVHHNLGEVCQYILTLWSPDWLILMNNTQINWASLELSVLHAYRQAHRLQTPSAFSSSYNQRILSRQGIGWSSPTMAVHKDRRRVSKDALALAVRKDFKDAMVQESEAITSFLYSVHNQGEQSTIESRVSLTSLKDKNFRMRFASSRSK